MFVQPDVSTLCSRTNRIGAPQSSVSQVKHASAELPILVTYTQATSLLGSVRACMLKDCSICR